MEEKDLDQSQNSENDVRTLGSKIRIVRLSKFSKIPNYENNDTHC